MKSYMNLSERKNSGRVICALLLVSLLVSVFGVTALAFRGSGVEVIAEGVTLIKTGLFGKKLCFTDADFKSAFATDSFDYITVTALPSSQDGMLLLAGRRVREGQRINRRNVAAMVFVPASKEIGEAEFRFTLDEGSECVCKMRFTDKINYAPETAEKTSLDYLVTQREIGLYGKMAASDPEGDAITYMVVAYPRGHLDYSKETGAYVYTPESNFTGYDSFTYVARDEWGNYSEAVTVSLKVIERMSEIVYLDMQDRAEYNAAVALTAMGVMSGELIGDGMYFMPDECVTRAEFLALAMKAMGIRPSESECFFDDKGEIPTALIGYVGEAARRGIVNGELVGTSLNFSPNENIKLTEAADIMYRLLGRNVGCEDEVFGEWEDVPLAHRNALLAMQTLGVIDTDGLMLDGMITRASAAELLYKLVNNS